MYNKNKQLNSALIASTNAIRTLETSGRIPVVISGKMSTGKQRLMSQLLKLFVSAESQ